MAGRTVIQVTHRPTRPRGTGRISPSTTARSPGRSPVPGSAAGRAGHAPAGRAAGGPVMTAAPARPAPGPRPGARHRRPAPGRGPLLRLLRLARPLRRSCCSRCWPARSAAGCGVALLATSGFLLARASQHPNIVAISVAVVLVRALSASAAGVLRYRRAPASHDAAFRVLADVRVAIYRRLERLAPAGLAAFRSGDLLARLISDVDATQDLFIRGIAPPLAAALVGAGAATPAADPGARGRGARRRAAGRRGARAIAAAARPAVRPGVPPPPAASSAPPSPTCWLAPPTCTPSARRPPGPGRAAADADLTRLARRGATASGAWHRPDHRHLRPDPLGRPGARSCRHRDRHADPSPARRDHPDCARRLRGGHRAARRGYPARPGPRLGWPDRGRTRRPRPGLRARPRPFPPPRGT